MTVLSQRRSKRVEHRRRRFTAFSGALAAFAVFALVLTSAAQSGKPKPARVSVNAVVEMVGPRAPDDPTLISLATVRVKLKAVDVDPTTPSCVGCPTADTGSLTVTKLDPDDPRPFIEISEEVDWVDLGPGPGKALVSASIWLLFLTDGGKPGNEVVGPPRPGGLATTRDSVDIHIFPSGDAFPGSLSAGKVKIKIRGDGGDDGDDGDD